MNLLVDAEADVVAFIPFVVSACDEGHLVHLIELVQQDLATLELDWLKLGEKLADEIVKFVIVPCVPSILDSSLLRFHNLELSEKVAQEVRIQVLEEHIID